VEDAVELAECGTWPPPVRRRARPPVPTFPPAPVPAAPARAR
jgi:hypothetical protein